MVSRKPLQRVGEDTGVYTFANVKGRRSFLTVTIPVVVRIGLNQHSTTTTYFLTTEMNG